VTPPLKAQSGRSGKGDGAPLAFAQNQRGELRESSRAMQLTGGGGNPGEGYSAVRDGGSVRRLTPTECERLQGLPDGWTQLGGTPDSRRYSALGDAVTATVGEWIGRRLAA
jgi:DNA (cytosine-5)-methyltransferase 1